MFNHTHKWLRTAFINLNIVALLGIILRYKIIFSLPIIDQKHLQHGHSHFAFAGWITQALMTLLVAFLYRKGQTNAFKKYAWLLIANLITAYGMLITFPIEGYGLFSITFSTLSILVSYFFAVVFWKDLNRLKSNSTSHYWFKAAVVFNALSSLGAFSLAFMMAKHVFHQNWYLSAVYFFLHFQYNGWFFFTCSGLLIAMLESFNIKSTFYKGIFWTFFLACFPAYFLSALWMPLPIWVYILIVLSAIAQVVGWFLMVKILFANLSSLKENISKGGKWLLSLSAIALTIKFLLQLGSTHPQLSTFAFGFRPIVIGYLHLVLLGVITIFIIGYIFANKLISISKNTIIGIGIFVFGILFNELFLMIQGIMNMQREIVPYTNELLFCAAIIMFSGILLIVISQFQKRELVTD